MAVFQVFDPEFEYEEECYQYLLKRETQIPHFHYRSPQMEYRPELIDRMQLLCNRFKLSVSVKFLSVYIMDFFMDNHDICEDKLELMVVSSILIAAKVDENDSQIPKISQLLTDSNQYLKREPLDMESLILKFFNFVLIIPTVATYIEYFYLKCVPQSNTSRELINTFLENSLELKYYRFRPSIIAAAIIWCIRYRFNLEPFWSIREESVTKYSFSKIENCVYELRKSDLLSQPKRLGVSTSYQLTVLNMNDSGIFEIEDTL